MEEGIKIERFNKVLILSVSVGAGHMRSAEALKKAAEILNPKAEVVILDTFRYASPLLEKLVLGTYMEILKVSPVVYGFLYRQSERGKPLSGRGKQEFNRFLNLLAAPKLVEYINGFSPDIIVCTHPFPLGIVTRMKKKNMFSGGVFAIITDFTIHSFWVFPEVDGYFIGADALKKLYEDFGIESEKVFATGIPIDPVFQVKYDKYILRDELGLDPCLPVILVMGGGLGMGPVQSAVKALGNMQNGRCQLIVVSGQNEILREKLIALAPQIKCPTKILGYVGNIHKLMGASDLMVGKAGGLSCAEALAMGLPVFIVDPLPGQEERNSEFMVKAGAGLRVQEKELAGIVDTFLTNRGNLDSMAKTARALGRPGAAYEAIKIMSSFCSPIIKGETTAAK